MARISGAQLALDPGVRRERGKARRIQARRGERRPYRPAARQPTRGQRKRFATRRTASARANYGFARRSLSRFRIGSMLAITVTALIILALGLPPAPLSGQEDLPAAVDGAVEEGGASIDAIPLSEEAAQKPTNAADSIREASSTLNELLANFYGLLPRLLFGLVLVLIGAVLARMVKMLMRRVSANWRRADAFAALSNVIIYLVAIGAALSVIAGDARALVGSVGLAGLALSWALQTPIESITGWLLNSLKGYYRVGDRIAVGEVFGDVYRIDVLTTTVWEAGGPEKPVQGAQPTGALITFPNWEILRTNIVNYTRDFPYVWDEITIGLANEADLRYAGEVIRKVVHRELGDTMGRSADHYLRLLKEQGLEAEVATEPQVYFSGADAWTDATVRYLVGARERRRWSSDLLLLIEDEIAKPEHKGRIISALPRQQIDILEEPSGGSAAS